MLPPWLTLPVETYRARRVAGAIRPHLSPHETLLDCGCGSMLVAQELQKRAGVRAFGTDVLHANHTDLSMCLSQGERLPFASRSVDNACLLFVLHHTSDPILVIRECLRVARKRLLVAEDVYQTPGEKRLLATLDSFGNGLISDNMHMPFNFKSEQEWLDVFGKLGVKVRHVGNIRPIPWRPSRHRLFVLEC